MGTIRRIYDKLQGHHDPVSFSQSGEDRIIYFLTQYAGIVEPTYLDIGAFDPWFINNTALFYKMGGHGWNIEPNQHRCAVLKKQRPRDINLNAGVSDMDGESTFFEMKEATLSTFSEEEAKRLDNAEPGMLKASYNVKVIRIATLIKQYCDGVFPDILSLDVEGMDEVIIRDMGSLSTLPSVICAETAIHTGGNLGPKKTGLIRSIESLGFVQYADTYINTIFLRKDLWT